MVTILKVVEGQCAWCCQITEAVDARFQDGLHGLFCKKDFWAALKARSQGSSSPTADTSKAGKPT